jgi:hypothetical protein
MHIYRRKAKFAAWYDDSEDEETGIPFKNPFRKYRATSRARREEDFPDILRPQSQSDVDLPHTDPLPTVKRGPQLQTKVQAHPNSVRKRRNCQIGLPRKIAQD